MTRCFFLLFMNSLLLLLGLELNSMSCMVRTCGPPIMRVVRLCGLLLASSSASEAEHLWGKHLLGTSRSDKWRCSAAYIPSGSPSAIGRLRVVSSAWSWVRRPHPEHVMSLRVFIVKRASACSRHACWKAQYQIIEYLFNNITTISNTVQQNKYVHKSTPTKPKYRKENHPHIPTPSPPQPSHS
jgi:hypothetical protein